MAENKGNSTSLSFGLCMKYGIKIMPNWTPRDAWNALYNAKKITPEQAYSEFGEKNAKRSRAVNLPQKEYASVCSAICTKHGDKIPRNGTLLYGNYFYRYKYNKKQEKFFCTYKLQIEGNEAMISWIIEGDE